MSEKPFDGISLAPWLLGKGGDAPDRVLFQHWAGRTSARDQRYRLDAIGQLFDMVEDPRQTKNIAADHSQVAKRLNEAVARWKRDVLGELPPVDDRPFTVGFAAFPRTVLPARDGVPHGGVKRSAAAPNCSFFTQWTKPDDRITWQVEVHTAGRYEAILHYTCAPADVGSELELSLSSSKVGRRTEGDRVDGRKAPPNNDFWQQGHHRREPCARPIVSSTATEFTASPPSTCRPT
jgi:hypothetical protein